MKPESAPAPSPTLSSGTESAGFEAHESPAALSAGTRLGGYVIERPLGHGGMGAVYEATQETLGRRVALKVTRPDLSDRAASRARFVREARALARLRHPHAVEVIDFGADKDRSYLVMELLHGETLAACLAREGPLPLPRACAILLPVFAAVATAHRAGIVHRDLKPPNIFLARTPEGLEWPKVLDFGVARLLDEEAMGVTSTGATVGTTAYMSPEQLLGAADVGPHGDQFSLAVVLYECLTGRRPFVAATSAGLYDAIARGDHPRASSLCPELPASLDRAIERALRRHPAERHPSVTAFARELAACAPDALRRTWEPAFNSTIAAPPATEDPPDTDSATLSTQATAVPRARALSRRRVFSLVALALVATAGVIARTRRDRSPATLSRARPEPGAPPRAVASVTPITVAPEPLASNVIAPPPATPAPVLAPARPVPLGSRPRAARPPIASPADAGTRSSPHDAATTTPSPRGTNDIPY